MLKNVRDALLAAVLMGAALATPSLAEDKPMTRSITVSATGTVSAKADLARITSGVMSQAPTARDALTANTDLMKRVVAELKTAGVDAADIQTSGFTVNPQISYSKDGQPGKINSYIVSNQVDVMVRDLEKLGDVLDKLVTVGANQINGLAFEVSKADALKDEARKEAMANALRRAKLLAEAGGATVGAVQSITEDMVSDTPRPYAMARTAKADAVPVEAGTSSLEARVTVVYELK